jgi:O-antigen/teichoic acid export membrane protein
LITEEQVAGPAPAQRLARSIAFNLGGVAIPAALALAALPFIARGLGAPRLGLLSLAWTVVGYLAVLNLGVGRALARDASRGRDAREIGSLAWTGVGITLTFGVLGGAVLFGVAAPLARALRLSPVIEGEAIAVFRLLALAIPWTVSTPSLVGLLEAAARFGRINLVGALVSAVSYLGPVAVLRFGGGLEAIVLLLGLTRAAAWLLYLGLCLQAFPGMRAPTAPTGDEARTILVFGGWSTVSAVISPLMSYLDRFAIGAYLSAGAVAYYSAPQEVAVRLGAISGAVVSVLFPAFAAAGGRGERARLANRGVAAMTLLLLPISLALASFARPALQLWLGQEYAKAGAAALVWLSIGLLFNAFAKVPSALIQAMGRPDLTARTHLAELPVYLGVLLGMVRWRGVEGAAIAWTLRTAADALVLYWIAVRLTPEARDAARLAASIAAATVGGVAVALVLPTLPLRMGWLLCVTAAVGIWGRSALRSGLSAPVATGRAEPCG